MNSYDDYKTQAPDDLHVCEICGEFTEKTFCNNCLQELKAENDKY